MVILNRGMNSLSAAAAAWVLSLSGDLGHHRGAATPQHWSKQLSQTQPPSAGGHVSGSKQTVRASLDSLYPCEYQRLQACDVIAAYPHIDGGDGCGT